MIAALLQGYAVAALACLALTAGALTLRLAAVFLPGGWSEAAGPALMAAARLLPLTALATVPATALRPVMLVCLALWAAAGWVAVGLAARRPIGRGVAAAGLILQALVATLFAFEGLKAIEPAFLSAVFGLILMAHQVLAALAFGIVMAARRQAGLGALLLAALLLWAYLGAMQFLIAWSGGLPAEADWYLRRAEGAWPAVLWLAVLLHGLPLAALFSGRIRENPVQLRRLAGMVLAGGVIEAAWLVLPAFPAALPQLAGLAGGLLLLGAGAAWQYRRAAS